MTLPSSGNITLANVLTELRVSNPGRNLPISLGDGDVRALAGKSTGQISLTDLYGKTSTAPVSNLVATASGQDVNQPNTQSAGSLSAVTAANASGGQSPYTYQWTIVGSSAIVTFGSLTGQSLTGTINYARNSGGNAYFSAYCTVRDSAGRTVTTNTADSNMSWGAL